MSQVKQRKSRAVTVDKNYTHNYCTRKNISRTCETCKSFEERVNSLQNALKDVLNQNDCLRSRVAELEALISCTEDDINEKQKIIQELYDLKSN